MIRQLVDNYPITAAWITVALCLAVLMGMIL
jgi:hypothetical protein